MNCTNCGATLSNDSSFCASCGTPRATAPTASPAAPAAQPTVVNNTPYTSNPEPVAPQNGMAIASLVTSIATVVLCGGLLSFVGAILGHVALGQIKRTGQGGRGLAIGGIVTGWAVTGLWLIFVLVIAVASRTSYYGY